MERAISELTDQHQQVHLSGRPVLFDLVMQAPRRFTTEARVALEAELQALRPAVARARFHLREHSDPETAARTLETIAARGSQGVVLKAPDHSLVRQAVDRLKRGGIPTVTLVTDVSDCSRVAYVGVDNFSAGATAAYLIQGWARSTGAVLLTSSHSSFRGEEERVRGFLATMASVARDREVHQVTDTDGLDGTMFEAVRTAIRNRPGVDAVYSVGGGNRAILAAFAEASRAPTVFIAHDLDADNRGLLRTRQVSIVLHHDLRDDMRRASRMLLMAGGLIPGRVASVPSQVQVVTPFNEPSAMRLV